MTPTLERVRRLEAAGYIEGYFARLNPARLGLGLLAYVEVSLDRTTPDAFERFKQVMLAHDEVMECHMVAGGFDYLLKVRVTDMESYRRFLGDRIACGARRAADAHLLRHGGGEVHPPPHRARERLAAEHLRGGAREVLEVLGAQSGDVDAAVVGHVDVVLLAQRRTCSVVMPRKENMPRWRGDEAEVALRAVRAQLRAPPRGAGPGCACACPPAPAPTRRAARRIGEDAPHDLRAVVRRHRPHAARQAHQLAQGRICAASGSSLMTCSAPVRSRYRPKFFEHDTAHTSSGSSAREQAHPEGIRIQPLAQALVGHVDEGQQRRRLTSSSTARHSSCGKVRAGRVVAGGVQQHHRARRQALQRAIIAPNCTPPVAASKYG